MNQIETLVNFYNSCDNKSPFEWLRNRSYSDGFVICLGAGPWKFGRRKTIQGMALSKLDGRDISNVSNEAWYPLDWQNKFLNAMSEHLVKNGLTMDEYCTSIKTRDSFFSFAPKSQYTKVISLFCRDGLKVESFPIDRHVKRKLEELKLPPNEIDMIQLCREAKLDARNVAVSFVRAASDMDNPDWSL